MEAAHLEKVVSDHQERNGDFTAVSLVAVRTCSAASAWACTGRHFVLAQLPLGETDSRAASSARCFLLPVELCKENRHLGFDVWQILLPYKRYRVPEAMVRVKYPHSSSLLSKNLRTTSYDRTPDNQTQDTHKIMYFKIIVFAWTQHRSGPASPRPHPACTHLCALPCFVQNHLCVHLLWRSLAPIWVNLFF